ncbi:MAG TPA: universal stress protein UspA, partial [Algoriphagus sp.]|nr:universal stress protein UspA [Algoriphagus sp.]
MKILIPLDFSDNSVKALEFAKGLCKKGENEIILL